MSWIVRSVFDVFTSTSKKEQQLEAKLAEQIEKLQIKCDEFNKENSIENNDIELKLSTSNCFQKIGSTIARRGIVTSLDSNHGVIDKILYFDITAIGGLDNIRVGCKVSYLAYKLSENYPIKIVKIIEVIDEVWDYVSEQQTKELINELTNVKPEYFSVHQRSIIGMVTKRNGSLVTIDSDASSVIVFDLEKVESQFVPCIGDNLCLNCNVQSDLSFVDLSGEVLDVTAIYPARSRTVKGIITGINNKYGHIDKKYFFFINALEIVYKPELGDRVIADAIESRQDESNVDYLWRCIKVVLVEKFNLEVLKITNEENVLSNNNNNNENDTKTENVNNRSTLLKNKCGIEITDNIKVEFNKLMEKKIFKMIVKNTSNESHFVEKSIILGRKIQSQINLRHPKRNETFEIKPNEEREYTFEARSTFYGQCTETIIVYFRKDFKIGRNIDINVAVEENENTNGQILKTQSAIGTGAATYRNTAYTHKIWNKNSDVIPGIKPVRSPHFLYNKIPQYVVPDRVRNAILKHNTFVECNEALDEIMPFFNNPLNIDNYAQYFQGLLHIEEVQLFHNFRKYDMERAHFFRQDEFLALEIENLSERRPSLVLGDSVQISNPWNTAGFSYSYEGCIHKVLCDRILLRFKKSFHDTYNGEDYKVEFHFSRSALRKQHFAVRKACTNLGNEILFPSKINTQQNPQLDIKLIDGDMIVNNSSEQKLEWYNESLNHIQREAVVNILQGIARPMPYLIFGPPGTGKTVTVVEAILQISTRIEDSRILVGTPSNSAANLITERLINSNLLLPGDFVRLVGVNSVEKELIPEHILPYCATTDISREGTSDTKMVITESGLKLRCNAKQLGKHKITVSTCSTLGTLLQMEFPKDHFTHVLIDECGQCFESESIIPMTFLNRKSGQIILSGDPMQLGPIVFSNYALERGLDISYLVRLLDRFPYHKDYTRFASGFDPRLVTKLIYNYRSLPSILNVYSNLFYDRELKPTLSEDESDEANILKILDEILPNHDIKSLNHGLFFIGIRGKNLQTVDSPSWYNAAEAKNIFYFLLQLYNKGMSPEDIGIITPYLQQVKIIRTLINDANLRVPKIGTVEEFQGQERKIILISTVRSTNSLIDSDTKHCLGFIKSPKRMNVAISRARALLMVFGNPHTLGLDINWKYLLKYCIEHNAYVGCDLPADLTADKEEE